MSRLISVIFTIPDDYSPQSLARTDFGIVGSLIKIPPRSFDSTKPSWSVACPQITPVDDDLRIEAMMHLESIEDRTSKDEVMDRVSAAHYLIQSMFGGPRPDNFEWIIAKARKWGEEK